MNWTKSGTLSVEAGKTAVYGLGTTWLSAGFARSGDILLIGDTICEVGSFQSDIQLTLRSPYQGATASGLSYALIHIGLLPSELALKVSTVLEKTQVTIAQLLAWETATTGTVALTDPATGATLQVAPLPVLLAQTPVDMNAVRALLNASADSAQASATTATASATSASASASAAAASEAAALVSKTAAAASQTSVSTLLASFRQYFLGTLAADPTVDGNGDPLREGAEYFNSVLDKLRTYVNGAWQDYDETAQAATNNANLSAASAAVSASSALASKDAAAASAASIGNAESNSAMYAAAALDSKTAVDAALVTAEQSKTDAATSAATAVTAAAAALAQATGAANSATASASSANDAASSVSAASTAAAAATASAGVATSQALQSTASALSSQNSAAAAALSAQQASVGNLVLKVAGKQGDVVLVAADIADLPDAVALSIIFGS